MTYLSDDIIRRLVAEASDRIPAMTDPLQQLFSLHDVESDQEDLFQLDQDSSHLFQTQYSLNAKMAEYSAVIRLSLLAQAAVCSGIGARLIYQFCEYYMRQLADAGTADEYERIVSDATVFFVSIIEDREPHVLRPPFIIKCKQYIDDHITASFSLDDIAAAAGVSSNYLSAQFSEYERMTLKEYILRRRVDAAKRLLQSPEHPIGCIANNLCFCSQSHFSQVFKKYTGLTPSAYRKLHARKSAAYQEEAKQG